MEMSRLLVRSLGVIEVLEGCFGLLDTGGMGIWLCDADVLAWGCRWSRSRSRTRSRRGAGRSLKQDS